MVTPRVQLFTTVGCVVQLTTWAMAQQDTAKPDGGNYAFNEGQQTTGSLEFQAGSNQGDVKFTAPARTPERLDWLPGGPGG